MNAHRHTGHLEFTPEGPLADRIAFAMAEFHKRHPKLQVSKVLVNPLHEKEVATLDLPDGVELVITNSIAERQTWVGGLTAGTQPRARIISKTAEPAEETQKIAALSEFVKQAPALVAAAEAAVKETVIPISETIKLADTAPLNHIIQYEAWRLFAGAPALPAPRIAGLLPSGTLQSEPDTPQEAEEEPAVLVILPTVEKVINPEYVLAFKAAQSASKDWRGQWEPFSQMMKRGEWPQQWITRDVPAEPAPASEPDQSAAVDEMVEMILPTGEIKRVPRDQYVPPVAAPAPLPQSLQSPDEVIKQIAEAKSIKPRVNELPPSGTNPLSMDAYLARHKKTPSEVMEETARRKAEIDPALIDDVLSALQAAIDEPENDAAQMLPHGLELVGDQFQISVVHPSGCALLVGVNLNPDEGYEWRFVASREGVRELVKGWKKKPEGIIAQQRIVSEERKIA